MYTRGIKLLLVLALCLVTFIAMLLVVLLFRHHRRPFLLVLACWQFCALVPKKIDLHGLGITCNLLLYGAQWLWCSPFILQAGTLCLQEICPNLHFHHQLIFQEKPKDVSVKDLGSFWGVFSQIDLCLHCIVPFIYTAVTLPEACEKVKVGSHII